MLTKAPASGEVVSLVPDRTPLKCRHRLLDLAQPGIDVVRQLVCLRMLGLERIVIAAFSAR